MFSSRRAAAAGDGASRPARGAGKMRSLVYKAGKTWWRAFVVRSKNGYLRVTSLHQQDADKVRREVEKASLKWKE